MEKYQTRFVISTALHKQIEAWRAANRDAETGRVLSFSEACRVLIARGLAQ